MENKDFFKLTKSERINHRQTYTTGNISLEGLSEKMKTVSDGNLHLHKKMESTENDNYIGKWTYLVFFWLFSLKDKELFKAGIGRLFLYRAG